MKTVIKGANFQCSDLLLNFQSWLSGGNTVTRVDAAVDEAVLTHHSALLKKAVQENLQQPIEHLKSFGKLPFLAVIKTQTSGSTSECTCMIPLYCQHFTISCYFHPKSSLLSYVSQKNQQVLWNRKGVSIYLFLPLVTLFECTLSLDLRKKAKYKFLQFSKSCSFLSGL